MGIDSSRVMGWLAAKLGSLGMSLVITFFEEHQRGACCYYCVGKELELVLLDRCAAFVLSPHHAFYAE